MAKERSITSDLTLTFGMLLVISIVQSAWHVRHAFSIERWLWDCLDHVISLVCFGVLLGIIVWRQSRPDKSIIRLKLSGGRTD
jgi:hypothetical protein